MTESSKNDRAVAAMAHELRQLVDTANAPIFGIDVDGKVNEWYVLNFSRVESVKKREPNFKIVLKICFCTLFVKVLTSKFFHL